MKRRGFLILLLTISFLNSQPYDRLVTKMLNSAEKILLDNAEKAMLDDTSSEYTGINYLEVGSFASDRIVRRLGEKDTLTILEENTDRFEELNKKFCQYDKVTVLKKDLIEFHQLNPWSRFEFIFHHKPFNTYDEHDYTFLDIALRNVMSDSGILYFTEYKLPGFLSSCIDPESQKCIDEFKSKGNITRVDNVLVPSTVRLYSYRMVK